MLFFMFLNTFYCIVLLTFLKSTTKSKITWFRGWVGGEAEPRGMSEINQSYYLSDEISKIIYVFWNLLSDYADLNKGFFNWKLLFPPETHVHPIQNVVGNIEVNEDSVPQTKRNPRCAVKFEASEENRITVHSSASPNC